ncbi:MAG: hypothetical protein P8Y69_09930 [Gammaproteobacteria bacterium]
MHYIQDNWKLIVGLAWLLATPNLWAEDAIRSISHGTYELPLVGTAPPGFAQVGELVACSDVEPGQPPQWLLRASIVFDRFDGVCDDLGEVPCEGRLVGIQESCTADGDGNVGAAGLIDAPYDRGARSRVCWDPSGLGQCTAEFEVAAGEGLGSQLTRLLDAPSGRTIGVSVVTGTRSFRVGTRSVRIRSSTARIDTLFEASTPESNCVLPLPFRPRESACGLATIATAISSEDD